MSSAPGTGRSSPWWRGLCALGLLAGAACQADTHLAARSSTARAAEREARDAGRQGRHEAAATRYRAAARLARNEGDARRAASCFLASGEASMRARQDSAARLSFSDAIGAFESPRIPSREARAGLLRAHTGLGDLDFQGGQLRSADAQYRKALGFATGRSRDDVLRRLALLAEHRGDGAAVRSWRSRILRDDPADQRRLELAFGRPPAARPSVAPTAIASVRMPPVLPRSAWGAARARANQDPMGRIWRLTVHHTATRFDNTSQATVAQHLRSVQNTHIKTNKWADIGYHLLIDGSGRVWQGRPLGTQGAHAGGPVLNKGNVGVALLGDFGRQAPNRRQAQALVQTLEALRAQFAIPLAQVHTHRDIRESYTECPGDALQSFVESYRRSPLQSLSRIDEGLEGSVWLARRDEARSGGVGCGCCPADSVERPRLPELPGPSAPPAYLLTSSGSPLPIPPSGDQPPPEAWAPPPDIRKSTARASRRV